MAKSWTEPFHAEAVKIFLNVIGVQLASCVEFAGRPDLQHPTSRQELLSALSRRVDHLRGTNPEHAEDLNRLHFALGEALEGVLFPNRVPKS